MAGMQEFIIIFNCINNYEVSLKKRLPSALVNVFTLNKYMWIQSMMKFHYFVRFEKRKQGNYVFPIIRSYRKDRKIN